MSEGLVHATIARARAGRPPARATDGSAAALPNVDVAAVLAALAEVPDPEIPVISIVDLGMIGDIRVDADAIRVALLPTFVGCPALDVIRASVERRLGTFDRAIDVRFDYRVPWTSDRITDAGRAALRASGFAPPAPSPIDDPMLVHVGSPVPCPYCGSTRTVLENAFGPSQCRAIHYCTACRQPFERFKTI